eukprot:7327805-Karenia_brevis.AAC.1
MEYLGVGGGVQPAENTSSSSEQPLALVSQAAAARAAAAAAASTALLQGADADQANEFIYAVRTAVLELATASHASPVLHQPPRHQSSLKDLHSQSAVQATPTSPVLIDACAQAA